MNDTEKLIALRNTAGHVGFLLDDPNPDNVAKAQKMLADALGKTIPGKFLVNPVEEAFAMVLSQKAKP